MMKNCQAIDLDAAILRHTQEAKYAYAAIVEWHKKDSIFAQHIDIKQAIAKYTRHHYAAIVLQAWRNYINESETR